MHGYSRSIKYQNPEIETQHTHILATKYIVSDDIPSDHFLCVKE